MAAHYCTWNVYFASYTNGNFSIRWRRALGEHRYRI